MAVVSEHWFKIYMILIWFSDLFQHDGNKITHTSPSNIFTACNVFSHKCGVAVISTSAIHQISAKQLTVYKTLIDLFSNKLKISAKALNKWILSIYKGLK